MSVEWKIIPGHTRYGRVDIDKDFLWRCIVAHGTVVENGFDVQISDALFGAEPHDDNKWVWNAHMPVPQHDIFCGIEPKDDGGWASPTSVAYPRNETLRIIVPTMFIRLQEYCGVGDILNFSFMCIVLLRQGIFQRAVIFRNGRAVPTSEILFFADIFGVESSRLHILNYQTGEVDPFRTNYDILMSIPQSKKMLTIDGQMYVRQHVSMLFSLLPIIQPVILMDTRLSGLPCWDECDGLYNAFVERLGTDRFRIVFDNPARNQQLFAHRDDTMSPDMPTVFMMPGAMRSTTINSVLGYTPSMIHMMRIIRDAAEVHMIDSFPSVFVNLLMKTLPHEFVGSKYHIYLRFLSGTWPMMEWYTSNYRPFRLVLPLQNKSEALSRRIMDSLREVHSHISMNICGDSAVEIGPFDLFLDQYANALDLPNHMIGGHIRVVLPSFYELWKSVHACFSVNIPMEKHPLIHPAFESLRKPIQLIDHSATDPDASSIRALPDHDAVVLVRLRETDPPYIIIEANSRGRVKDPAPDLVGLIDSILTMAPYVFTYHSDDQKEWLCRQLIPSS